jgi:amino acid permease
MTVGYGEVLETAGDYAHMIGYPVSGISVNVTITGVIALSPTTRLYSGDLFTVCVALKEKGHAPKS